MCVALAAAMVGSMPVWSAQEGEGPAPARVEGAIGLIGNWHPEYSGAAKHTFGLVPAGFIRWGRFTISGAGGFTTRQDSNEVERGLAASLIERDRLRVNLALRFDNGRRTSDSLSLAAMDDIKRTVRARLLVRWQPDEVWTLSASSSVDVLGRGGGFWGDVGASREWRLSPRSRLQAGLVLNYAGDSYLQTWYGVSPEQSARSGYPVFSPGEGLRDLALGLTVRTDFNPRWSGFVSAGASRLVGSTVDSPLVQRPSAWTLGSGLAWRF